MTGPDGIENGCAKNIPMIVVITEVMTPTINVILKLFVTCDDITDGNMTKDEISLYYIHLF